MKISIREVGLREGVQISKKLIPTESKLAILKKLGSLPFLKIEATSVVRPDLVPAHADCKEILGEIENWPEAEKFTALYLNVKGFLIARNFRVGLEPWIHTALDELFLSTNVGRSFNSEKDFFVEIQKVFKANNFESCKIMVSCAFGYKTSASLDELLGRLDNIFGELSMPVDEICLADTLGIATPRKVRQFVPAVQRYSRAVSLHLHDTHGLGILNAIEGANLGVEIFESSICGLGGCPFVHGAAGNVATEELVLALQESGYKVDITLDDLLPIIQEVSKLFEGEIHSKLARKIVTTSKV
ncbi:MAG: hypothetical protein NZT61_00180 [Deltaproteobacteria bacterium]|nr:hypothetical protein [Deltaproteobacteria bacterium]MCX7952855.1 hypothetical protein [Deltaproteobacteria bacterium]